VVGNLGESKQTRRSFLDWLLGLTALGWLGTIIYPVVRYLTPLPDSGPSGPAHLDAAEVETLETKQFVIVPVAGARVLVFETPDQAIHALDAKCTHEGCTVQYVPGEEVVWCACHNGRFAIDGRVLSGPPPKPLPRYNVTREDDGSIVVAPEAA